MILSAEAGAVLDEIIYRLGKKMMQSPEIFICISPKPEKRNRPNFQTLHESGVEIYQRRQNIGK